MTCCDNTTLQCLHTLCGSVTQVDYVHQMLYAVTYSLTVNPQLSLDQGDINNCTTLCDDNQDSDCTIVITIVYWPKRIIIVQKLTSVVEFWALLSSRWSSRLWRHIHVRGEAHMRTLGHNNDAAKRCSVTAWLNYFLCESCRYSLWLIFASPVSYWCLQPVAALLFQRILWVTEALFWQNLRMYPIIYRTISI